MTGYLSFTLLALIVALAPGPDSLLTLRNTVVRGRTAGFWTMIGICLAGSVQGVAAAAGLGALIVHAQPVFQAIRWLGVAYLGFLGVSALLAAWRGQTPDPVQDGGAVRGSAITVARQGFLCNITNPKVLVFNLAVLPQFVGQHASTVLFLLYALTLTALGAVVLIGIVLAATRAKGALARRSVNRTVEATTGVVMLGFAAALASEA